MIGTEKFACLAIFVFLNYNLFAQTDSLKNIYKVQKGDEKFATGLLICEGLVDNPEAYLSFSKDFCNLTINDGKTNMFDVLAMRHVADAYYYADSMEQSAMSLERAIAIAENVVNRDSFIIAQIYNDLSVFYLEDGRLAESKQLLQKAIAYLENSDSLDVIADTKTNLAILYHTEGNYENAITWFNEVYQIDLKTGNQKNQSSSLNNLGRIFVDWGKYETGIEHYKNAIALLDTITDKALLSVRYNNLGMAYQLMGLHNEAILWLKKALQIEEHFGKSLRLAVRYNNLANSYMALNEYETTLEYFEKAKDLFMPSGQWPQISKILGNMGVLYQKTGKLGEAEAAFLNSVEYAQKAKLIPELSIAYERLYLYYKTVKQAEKALHFHELFVETKDSIFNIQVSEQVEQMEALYQNRQKQSEIERLEAENELKKREITLKNRQRNGAIAGVALLLLVIVIMYKLYTLLRKQKGRLAAQNIELDRLNKSLNRLFAIISHDLRNATASYQSSAKIISHYLNKGEPEKLLPLSAEIDNNARNLSNMLENLLLWSVSQLNGFVPNPEKVGIKPLVDTVGDMLKSEIERKDNTLEVLIEPDCEVYCDSESLSLIVRNLVGNACKFTQNGTIKVRTADNGTFCDILFEDTGRGIEAEKIEQLFRFTGEKPTQGTLGEKGTGLGLVLVAEHVRKNWGSIKVESELGKGTIFTVSLPKNGKL